MKIQDFITIEEYAKITGVTRQTVRKWIKGGTIEAHQIIPRGRILINKLEIPAFLREKESK